MYFNRFNYMSESTILLVEDDKVQGNAAKNYLETSGYEGHMG